MLIALIMGCSQKDLTRESKKVYGIKNLDSLFKKYNYRYKIGCVDTRNWTKNKNSILKTRKIIDKFGKNLGKRAIIANLIDKTSRKRAYIRKVQRQLNTYYNLDTQAPFFILYKKGNRRGYTPYKIVSISSMSLQSLRKNLSILTNAINSGRSKKSIYASLNRFKADKYTSSRGMNIEVKELLIEALESTI